MKRVTLQFPDSDSLWAFARMLRSEHIYINGSEQRLTCHCSEDEISKALIHFKARILDEVEERNSLGK